MRVVCVLFQVATCSTEHLCNHRNTYRIWSFKKLCVSRRAVAFPAGMYVYGRSCLESWLPRGGSTSAKVPPLFMILFRQSHAHLLKLVRFTEFIKSNCCTLCCMHGFSITCFCTCQSFFAVPSVR